ncbi:hypothetical protein E2C01_006676 [Portunus trituberculatus]|uniref:Uncharacterized protein n=1 Tax=Portunus trituberculatus TaxID=210409 RepID=A0A5B7CVR5_PORTR|nr:hypothetical protein [Portunus trituberculatus]
MLHLSPLPSPLSSLSPRTTNPRHHTVPELLCERCLVDPVPLTRSCRRIHSHSHSYAHPR